MSAEEGDDYDFGGLDEIDEAECWRLLATQPVGRVAINVGHYPLIFPVNHAVVAHGVVFRTAPGTKLWATHRSNVSFEVDHVDIDNQTGWSVLVRGSAKEITVDTANPELVEIVAPPRPNRGRRGRGNIWFASSPTPSAAAASAPRGRHRPPDGP